MAGDAESARDVAPVERAPGRGYGGGGYVSSAAAAAAKGGGKGGRVGRGGGLMSQRITDLFADLDEPAKGPRAPAQEEDTPEEKEDVTDDMLAGLSASLDSGRRAGAIAEDREAMPWQMQREPEEPERSNPMAGSRMPMGHEEEEEEPEPPRRGPMQNDNRQFAAGRSSFPIGPGAPAGNNGAVARPPPSAAAGFAPPEQPQQRVNQRLLFDLDSHIADLVIEWRRGGLIEGFELIGDCGAMSLETWTHDLYRKGAELQPEDFGQNGLEINLRGNAVGNMALEDLQQLMTALKRDSAVKKLRLSQNFLGDGGVEWIAGGLMHQKTLRELYLSHNGITDQGVAGLAALLTMNTTLRLLHLGDNRIGSTGAGNICEAFGMNRALTELDLSNNKIGDEGMIAIAEALDREGSCALQILNMSGNPLMKKGVDRLTAAYDKGALSTLNLGVSYHSRQKDGADWGASNDRFVVICSKQGTGLGPQTMKCKVNFKQEDDEIEVVLTNADLKKHDMKLVKVDIGYEQLKVKLRGAMLIDEELYSKVQPEEATWTLSDGALKVNAPKVTRGAWPRLGKGT